MNTPMNKQLSQAGTLLLIVGGVAFVWAGPKMDVARSGLGQLAAAFSSQAASEMQMWQFVYYGGILGIICGIVLLILGATRPSSTNG